MIPRTNPAERTQSGHSPPVSAENVANPVLWEPPDADYYFRETLRDGRRVLYRLARRGRHQGLTLYRENDETGSRALPPANFGEEVGTRIKDADPDLFAAHPKVFQQKVLELLECILFHGTKGIRNDKIILNVWGIEADRTTFASALKNFYHFCGRLRTLLHDKGRRGTSRLLIVAESVTRISAKVYVKEYSDACASDSRIEDHAAIAPRAWPRTLLDTFASVPPLLNYFDRAELLNGLVADLTSKATGPVGITVLQADGGVGKTTLAIAACRDQRVRDAFRNGIVWLEFGSERNQSFKQHVEQICGKLNTHFEEYSRATLQTLLQGQSVLLVLDDVWRLEDVEGFIMESPGSRLLITTRDRTLAPSLRASPHEIGPLDPVSARRFLDACSDRSGNLPEPHASDLLTECDGLILALAMLGASLRNEPDQKWKDAVRALRQPQLKSSGRPLAEYKYETLQAAIGSSVEALPPPHRERYRKMALWPEAITLPLPVLQALWAEPDEEEVADSIQLFIDRSLARSQFDGIVLHSLQLKYLRSECPHPRALNALRKAVMRSLHVITRDPNQFYSQLTSRLLGESHDSEMASFLKAIDKGTKKPRLRPVISGLDAIDGPARAILTGHKGPVNSIAVTPDGRYAVSGSDDCAVIVWDLQYLRIKQIFTGHSQAVRTVSVSRDGRHIVSGSDDGTVRIWKFAGQGEPRVLTEMGGRVSSVAVSADGMRIIAGSDAVHTLSVWDLKSGSHYLLPSHRRPITAVAMAPNGECMVAATADRSRRGSVVFWNWIDGPAGRPIRLRGSYQGCISGLAWLASGKQILSGDIYGSVGLWDLECRRRVHSYGCHIGPGDVTDCTVRAVAATSDGFQAISAQSFDLTIWDLENGPLGGTRLSAQSRINCLALSDSGDIGLSGCEDGTISLWSFQRTNDRAQHDHEDKVRCIALSSNGERILSGSDSSMLLWKADTPHPRFSPRDFSVLHSMAVDFDRNVAISVGSPPMLLRWKLTDVFECDVLRRGFDHTVCFDSVAITANGTRAVALCNGDLHRWDLIAGSEERRQKLLGPLWYCVALSSDGSRAVAAKARSLKVLDLNSRATRLLQVTHDVAEPVPVVRTVAITPDGEWAVSGYSSGNIVVWPLRNYRKPWIIRVSQKPINVLAINPDGKWIAVGFSNEITILNARGLKLAAFTCDGEVTACACSDTRVAIGDSKGRVHLLALEEL